MLNACSRDRRHQPGLFRVYVPSIRSQHLKLGGRRFSRAWATRTICTYVCSHVVYASTRVCATRLVSNWHVLRPEQRQRPPLEGHTQHKVGRPELVLPDQSVRCRTHTTSFMRHRVPRAIDTYVDTVHVPTCPQLSSRDRGAGSEGGANAVGSGSPQAMPCTRVC